jgi:hypothetical protein
MSNSKRRLVLSLAVLCATLASTSAPADAGFNDVPNPVPGWTHPTAFQLDTAQRHGVLLEGAEIWRGSSTIANIDGDASNGNEVAVAGRDARLYVMRANGSVLWSKMLPVGTCDVVPGDDRAFGAPSVADLYGDGTQYIVMTFGTILGTPCDGGVVVYNGATGQERWRFSLRNWQRVQGHEPEAIYGVSGTAALADVDGNGTLEIGFGGLDRYVYLLNTDGSVRYYYHAADTIWGSPAFLDADGDGTLEMALGTDISAYAPSGTSDGGYLYLFNTAPRSPLRGQFCLPRETNCNPGLYRWRTLFEQTIWSSPVIADVLPSNPGDEIVVGSGCYFPAGAPNKTGRWIKILRPSDGAVLKTLDAPNCVMSSVAVGDVDDDGALEIVASVSADPGTADTKSSVLMWNPENSAPAWRTVPVGIVSPIEPNGINDANGGYLMSPVIADLDGNGSLEVIMANAVHMVILNGKTGAQLTCEGSGCGAKPTLFTSDTLGSTPSVGDLNGDGKLDLVIGGSHYNRKNLGMLYAWTDFAGRLNSPAGRQRAYSAPWPMSRGGPAHTGRAQTARLSASTNAITELMQIGTRKQLAITVRAPGDWTATAADSRAVLLSPAQGSGNATLTIDLVAPQSAGDVVTLITIASEGSPDLTIPVTIKAVTQLERLWLPLTRK